MIDEARQLHRRRLIASAAIAAVAVVSVAACGSSSKSGSSSPGAGGGSGSSVSAEVAAARADIAAHTSPVLSYPAVPTVAGTQALRGKTVWYVPLGAAVPILAAFGTSMQDALSHLGVEVHTCDGKFLPTQIASCFNQAITQGADGVVGGYVDYNLVSAAYDDLAAHHIPTLVAGVAPEAGKTNSPQFAFYNADANSQLTGKLLAESVIADSNGNAHVLYVGDTDTAALVRATSYTKDFFAQHCPGCSFSVVNYTTANINKVPSAVSAGLISHPDTTYVLPGVDVTAAGSLSGIQTAGFENKVKLASTTASLDSMQRLKAGGTPQFLDVGNSNAYSGWLFADNIVAMLTNHAPVSSVNAVIRIFTHDNVGDLSLTPSAYASNQWYGSDAFKATFLSAWGAS